MVLAAPASGSGKTTIAAAIAAALRARGLRVQPYKAGPDFIDPGHLERAAGRRARNLDGWMTPRRYVEDLVARTSSDADVALLEGMMGLFDGLEASSNRSSTAELAAWLGWPVVLIVDASAAARSVAALVRGFRTFDAAIDVAAVVFNRVGGAGHQELLRCACAEEGVAVLGGLPTCADLTIPERHLGLHLAAEGDVAPPLHALAGAAEEHLDLEALLALAGLERHGAGAAPAPGGFEASTSQTAAEVPASPASRTGQRAAAPRCRIAVARDAAFSFYYEDNLELLAAAGAELIEWSPLASHGLPPGIDGLYLGGGYPELHAGRLAAAAGLRAEVKEFAERGGMIYAECGGLMFLCDAIRDQDGAEAPMVGLLPSRAVVGRSLAAIGYVEVDAALAGQALRVRGHEFRYSRLDRSPVGALQDGERVREAFALVAGHGAPGVGFAWRRVLASYVHLHFGSAPQLAAALVERAAAFRCAHA